MFLCGNDFRDEPEIDAKLDSKGKQEFQALAGVIAERGTQGREADKESKKPDFRVETYLRAILGRKVVRQNGQSCGNVPDLIWHKEGKDVLRTADMNERPDTEHVIGEVGQNNLGQNDWVAWVRWVC